MKPFAFAAALAAGLVLSGPVLSSPAAAASPTDAEVAQIQQLLGFDVAIERVIVGKIDKSEAFKGFTDQQRGCIKGELMPGFKASMLDSFRSLFGDGETIAAWKTFGQTKGGAKFVAGAEPDGYTLLCGNISSLVVTPLFNRYRDYDPATAFTPSAWRSRSASASTSRSGTGRPAPAPAVISNAPSTVSSLMIAMGTATSTSAPMRRESFGSTPSK